MTILAGAAPDLPDCLPTGAPYTLRVMATTTTAAGRKRKARALAMQVLYLWDAHAREEADLARQLVADGTDDPGVRSAALEMARGAWAQREQIDTRVDRLAPNWPSRRQPPVDRNLIRLAIWELTSADTPPKVVLDEAIELAKEFSTEQSPSFVNGVLDAVLREHRALVAEGVAPTALTSSAEPAAAVTGVPAEPHGAQVLDAPAEGGETIAAPRDAGAMFDVEVRPLFEPDRRIDDPFLAALEVRLLTAGAARDAAARITGAVRSRWQSGQLQTTEQALPVVRDQVLHTLGGRQGPL
jgi:transcription antitermination protein NusB